MAGWLMYRLLQVSMRLMIAIGWWRWRIEGLEKLPPRQDGGIIFAMNHVHWIDIPAVGVLLPFEYRLSWLAKSELFANPLVGWWLRSMNAVPIKRGKRDMGALLAAEELLKGGATMLVFPEGHRSKTGVLQEGRSGAVRLAARSGVPIVPLAIIGTQQGTKGTLLRKEVCLRIGEPYTIPAHLSKKVPPDTMAMLTDDMMSRIAGMLPPDYRGPYQPQEAALEVGS
jgi:1-acyl-sn-glycerol-3-phosphate acyltransferase